MQISGVPVAPHNGLNPGWEFNEATGEVTLTGLGAYLGLPKAVNAGELPNVDVPESVTYSVMMAGNMMTVIIEAGTGVFWTFELAKEGEHHQEPIFGTWKLAPMPGALRVDLQLGAVNGGPVPLRMLKPELVFLMMNIFFMMMAHFKIF